MNKDIDALLLKIQNERRRDFSEPNFGEFFACYQVDAPEILVDLYSTGDALLSTGIQYKSLWVENFFPLSAKSVRDSARQYGCRFYRFAAGGEGQAYLVCISDPSSIWIDYNSDGDSVEDLHIEMQSLVREVRDYHKVNKDTHNSSS